MDRDRGNFRASLWADLPEGKRVGWRVLSGSYMWELENHPGLLTGMDIGDTPLTDVAVVELLPGAAVTNDILAVAQEHTLYCFLMMWDVTVWFTAGFTGTLWKHLPPLPKPYDSERLIFKRDKTR